MVSKLDPSRNYSYLAIAAFFGFLGFMMQPTAYTWGEQDMMPFFERFFNPDYLTNDFFTNSTATKNPRWVFGYFIIAVSWVTNLPWYKVLYIFKLLFLLVSPILYYKVLIVLLRKYVEGKALSWVSPFVLICLVLMVFLNEYRYYFAVASWVNYFPAFHANVISIALGFIGILIKEGGRHPIWYSPFFFLSCLMHPAIGLFSIGFYTIFLLPEFKKEFKRHLPVLASALVAVLLVKMVFSPQNTLSTAEFIDIYVKERHPRHYSVPDFINLRGSWITFFALVNALFAIPFFYGLIRRNRPLWLVSLFAWVAYSGAIALQYTFIEVVPLKLFAYLGISRFTTFGYWMLVVLWGMVLSDFVKKDKPFVFPSLGPKNFGIIIINLIFVGILFIDNPKENIYLKQRAYYDFVQSTPKDAIFITYSPTLNTDMRLIGRRGVFISNEFPFAEQYIAEYGERRQLVFGSRKQELYGMDFYRSLKPSDFYKISKKYQLDYILVENRFNAQFANHTPVWKDQRHSIYAIKNFKL